MKQEEFWNKRSEKYDENIRKESFYSKTIEKTKKFLSETDCVLDYACATGEMSLDFANNVKQIHGIDTSKAMIDRAKEKRADQNIDNVQFYIGDLDHAEIIENKYSKILALNILHLVDDASTKTYKLFNLLDNDGILITSTPCLGERGWLMKSLIILMQKIGLAPPILNLTYKQLELILSNNNFEIVENEILDADTNTQWLVAKKKHM